MDPKRIHMLEKQTLKITGFPDDWPVLDIGGGGEGVIGRIKPRDVVAIDLQMDELLEAPPGPVKLVMDAREMQFAPETFAVATLFFSLMYMKGEDRKQVFEQTFNVLRPGGRLLVWDSVIPPHAGGEKDVWAIPLVIQLPNGQEIETSYGTLWPGQEMDHSSIAAVAESAGFEIKDVRPGDKWFFLEMVKKQQ